MKALEILSATKNSPIRELWIKPKVRQRRLGATLKTLPKRCNSRTRTLQPTRHTRGGTRSVSRCKTPRKKPPGRSTNSRSVIPPDAPWLRSFLSVATLSLLKTSARGFLVFIRRMETHPNVEKHDVRMGQREVIWDGNKSKSKAADRSVRSTRIRRRGRASRLFLLDLLRGRARRVGLCGGCVRIRGCRPRLRLARRVRESRSPRNWHGGCERLRRAGLESAHFHLDFAVLEKCSGLLRSLRWDRECVRIAAGIRSLVCGLRLRLLRGCGRDRIRRAVARSSRRPSRKRLLGPWLPQSWDRMMKL